MPIVQVPWIQLPTSKFEQLKNGTKGIVFKISPQYVAKILYSSDGENYLLRRDDQAYQELSYENNINKALYDLGIGNVPRPMGVESLGIFNGEYPAYIMEYITDLPHGDQLKTPSEQFEAENLIMKEVHLAANNDIYPGKDYLHPWNYFYDRENYRVRLIDFGRWTVGDLEVSPYD